MTNCSDCSNSTLCSDCSDRPEAETVLQPSLHTLDEFCKLLLEEAEARSVDVTDLHSEVYYNRWERTGLHPREHLHPMSGEIIDDVKDRLFDAGYETVEQDDTFLIFAKGQGVPKDWSE